MKRMAIAVVIAAAIPVEAQDAASAPGGVVRWLDKLSGQVADVDLSRGQSVKQGRLTIQLDECRYPVADPASNAYAHLTIMDELQPAPVFSGWMIASSPALSALDHPRYDVWILRCDIR
jgi:hypothetical protein